MAESSFDWSELIKIIADLGGSYFGFKEAQDKSQNTITPKDAFGINNPNYANPFQQRTTDWNGGNPNITQEFSPAVMDMINEWVGRADKAGQGRTPYGMDDGMRDIYGQQQNWQRERMGLDPAPRPEQYDPYSGQESSERVVDELAREITNPEEWTPDNNGEEDILGGIGFPDDYLNDKGNVKRKYRPGNRNYVGDEELRRWMEDPDYEGAVLPDDYYNDKGNVRRRYRGQEYYSDPMNPDIAIFGTGTGAPDDWLNNKGNIARRYREGSKQYGGSDYRDPNWEQPEDWLNDKGNVRRKYRYTDEGG